MSAAGKPTALQREKFRKFVERAGITELVTKALVDLYEEQLQDHDEALAFFRNKVATTSNKEIELAKARIQELEAKLAFLQVTEENTPA